MKKPSIAIVRGAFLNAYEMQFYEPLKSTYQLTAFGSKSSFHSSFEFPVVQLWSPMDIPQFPYKMSVLNRIFIDAHMLLSLEKSLRGFDIAHSAETYFHYTQQCINAKQKGYVKKVITTVLENIPFNNEGIWGRKSFKKRAREQSDWLIALTQKTKQALLLEGANEQKITVLGHFIDTSRFSPRRKKNNSKYLTVLYVGRLEYYKGVLDVLTIFHALLRDESLSSYDLTLHVVGDGTLYHVMQSIEKKLQIESHVVHSTHAYNEMPSVYEKADIFIAPSKPIPTYEEQYCTALLEAQAAGLPIITTVCGGIPENVGDAGVLVQPGDVGAMTNAAKNFILHENAREEYAKKARKRAVLVHDHKRGAKKLDEIYTHVLSI